MRYPLLVATVALLATPFQVAETRKDPLPEAPAAESTAPHGGPIIDMHLHAFAWDEYGDPPPPDDATGRRPAARTNEAAMAATLAEMDRHGVVLGVASGRPEIVALWRRAAPERFLGGSYASGRVHLPEIDTLREAFASGELAVHGELGLQYMGMGLDDPRLEAHLALAVELDVPVALHTGLGPPGSPHGCCPDFRTTLGNPSRLEEALVRYQDLRVVLMHAGWPWLEETKAILYMYPNVHVDLGVLGWSLPRAEFHAYLEALVIAGFGKRILFGSDQMIWPHTIGLAIESLDSAPFLSDLQKRDIFYNNAAAFLGLPPELVEAHHRSASKRSR